MPSFEPPKKFFLYVFFTGLRSCANSYALQNNPTIVAGDVLVQQDDGPAVPIATLPTAVGKRVKVELSALEMNADNVTVIFSDVSGNEWCDLLVNIQTAIDIYPVDIALTVDSVAGSDEWTVQWFRNGVPLEEDEVSSPTLRVISRATGSDLLPGGTVAMDAIGAGACYKYDSTVVITPGQAVIVEAAAVVDGAVRTWRKIVTRDD